MQETRLALAISSGHRLVNLVVQLVLHGPSVCCSRRGTLRTKPALHGAVAMWNRQVRVVLLLPCRMGCGCVCSRLLSFGSKGLLCSASSMCADIHSPATTVHEALLFSATLRLPEGVGPAAVRAFVREIERVVEMEDIQNALVGMPGKPDLQNPLMPAFCF